MLHLNVEHFLSIGQRNDGSRLTQAQEYSNSAAEDTC